MRSDKDTLDDIIRCCHLIQLFVEGITEEEFVADLKTQAAVQHQLLVLGEATKRLSQTFRTSHPEIPWSPMARMRDKLIHAYDLINQAEVWRTATRDVPQLRNQLEVLLSDLP